LAAQDYEQLENDDDLEAQQIPNGKIIVDFSYGTPDLPSHVSDLEHTPTFDNPANKFSHPDAPVSRRLSSLLRMLIKFPPFRDSPKLIEVYPYGAIAARDFFIPLEAVTSQYSAMFRGFWGLITDAQSAEDGSIWLNSGGRENMSFCIDYKFVDLMIKRYRLNSLEDLAGAHILVFGSLHVSTNGKLHVIIQEPEFIALRLLRT
jgi:hypothetical protein